MNFKEEIIVLLKPFVGEGVDLAGLIEVPPNTQMGDYALPCFSFAKSFRKSPNAIAEELAARITIKGGIVKVQPVGPYLNFFVDKSFFTKEVLSAIFKKKEAYGSSKKKKEKILVEYSQPNPLKAFHVGHIRGTALGESLARILRFNGYKVIQANYMGDTGAHIGKWLWCYMKFHKGEMPAKEGREKWMASVYVESVAKSKENEKYKGEISLVNYELERGKNTQLKAAWKTFRKMSIGDFKKVYKDLDAHFDLWFFESQMEKRGRNIVKSLVKKGIALESEGVPIMDLKEYGLGVWVLLRADGTTLYSAKDIALAEIKFREEKIDKSVYVVGNAQSLHMCQLFKTLDLMGFKQAKHCFHLSFDEVRLPSGQMSSRTGQNILYIDLRENMLSHSIKETRKRHAGWSKARVERSSFSLAISAMKFSMIDHDPNKKIIFDMSKALAFEGDTGPYVQYAHARCCSILAKVKHKPSVAINFGFLKTPEEERLIAVLSRFEGIIEAAALGYRPFIVSRFVLELAHRFNEFYHTCQCNVEDEALGRARILLVDCTRQILVNSLYLLGIASPKEM